MSFSKSVMAGTAVLSYLLAHPAYTQKGQLPGEEFMSPLRQSTLDSECDSCKRDGTNTFLIGRDWQSRVLGALIRLLKLT